MKIYKIVLLAFGLVATSVVEASETFDCSGQGWDTTFFLSGAAKKIVSELKGEAPVFIKNYYKAVTSKDDTADQAVKKAKDGITCTVLGIEKQNFLSITFKNKYDRYGDYQVEFTPEGGYKNWLHSTNNKLNICYEGTVHKVGRNVNVPNSGDIYRIYVRVERITFGKVVNSCS
jgi:hypothetical protein